MRNFKLVLGAAVIAASFASCKDEAKMTAEKHVDHYVVFVDSINSPFRSQGTSLDTSRKTLQTRSSVPSTMPTSLVAISIALFKTL